MNSVRVKFNSQSKNGKYDIKLLKLSCLPVRVKFNAQTRQLVKIITSF